jgi:hypothetical protein
LKTSHAPFKRNDKPAPRRRKAALTALAAESERHLDDLIRRRLALPVEKRVNLLRVRLPGGGSAL